MTGMLDGKAIIVTGAGQGIGEAIARLAAAEGAQVLVNDLNRSNAERVMADIREAGGRASAFEADTALWSNGQVLVEACLTAFGRLDGLVNNAGVFRIAPLTETTEADFTDTFNVNVLGVAACARAAARHMMAQGSGSIVNIVSGAQCGMHGLGAYGASKGAVASLTYAWAVELASSGVRMNAVSPRANTHMAQKVRGYMASLGVPPPQSDPPDTANAPVICYLLTDRAAAIHGQVVRIDGRLLSLMTHPAVLAPAIEHEHWTVDAVATAFADRLAARRQPLGVVQAGMAPST